MPNKPNKPNRTKRKHGPAPRKRNPYAKPRAALRLTIDATPKWAAAAPNNRPSFQPETLARAIEAGLSGKNGFVWKAWTQAARSSATVERGTLALLAETDRQLEWTLSLAGANRTRATLRLVVARNDAAAGEYLAESFGLLKRVHAAAKSFPTPLAFGKLYLPDRHRRKSHDRHLPAYITKPLPKSLPCVFGPPGQLGVLHDNALALLSRDDTDAVKAQVLSACIATYDPRAREGLVPPHLNDTALRVAERKAVPPRVHIAFLSKSWPRLDAAAYLDRLVEFAWKAGPEREPLAPVDPDAFRQALVDALGKPGAGKLLAEYAARIQRKKAPPKHGFDAATLKTLANALQPPAR